MTNRDIGLTFSAIMVVMAAEAMPKLEGGPSSILRSPASVRILVELAAEHGVPAARCLEGTGLQTTDLTSADAEVEASRNWP
jgi:hypothetical protein